MRIRARVYGVHASLRPLISGLALVVGLAAPSALDGQCGCTGCLELCRQTFGALRGVEGKVMVLSECFERDSTTYCVYKQWGA